MIALRTAAQLVAVLIITACSGEGHDEDSRPTAEAVSASPVASSSAAGASRVGSEREGSANGGPSFAMGDDGSASMHTRNRAMQMSLRHDSIVVAFSDSIRTAVKREVAESMNKDSAAESALGQVIQGVVKSSVSGALGEVFEKSRGFPLSSLRGIDYNDGAIEFDFVSKPTWSLDGIKTDDTPLLEQFHPADAARFVGAVRARLKH